MDAFNDVLMFLGSTVCHQLSERSYFYEGVQMPLCARCIGIHFGFILTASFLLLGPKRYASKLPSIKQLAVLAAIMSFFLIDAGLSYSGISTSDNLRRTLSGLALGVPLPFVLVPLLNILSRPSRSSEGVLDNSYDWLALPVLYGTGLVAIISAEDFGPLFYAVSIVGVFGVFLFFSAMLSTIVLIAFEKNPMVIRNKIALATVLAVSLLMALAALNRAITGA
jgi:uncharacterized membrane protein